MLVTLYYMPISSLLGTVRTGSERETILLLKKCIVFKYDLFFRPCSRLRKEYQFALKLLIKIAHHLLPDTISNEIKALINKSSQ